MNFKSTVGFMLVLSYVFVAGGCDKYTNYKVLSFFFSGVPHPEKQPDLLLLTGQKSLKDTGDEVGEKSVESVTISSTHGPYAAGQCFLCHKMSSAKGELDKGGTKRKIPETNKGFRVDLPEKLLKPIEELCIECHASKSLQSAFDNNLWIHGPVSSGICTVCHDAHSSGNSYMLRQGKPNDLCATCHAEGLLSQSEDHQLGKDCISCHNAHLGLNRFLLKKDFDEIY